MYLTSRPVREVAQLLRAGGIILQQLTMQPELGRSSRLPALGDKFQLRLSTRQLTDFSLKLSKSRGEELVIGYDQQANAYYVDRSKAGQVAFSDKFPGRHAGPRRATGLGRPHPAVRCFFGVALRRQRADSPYGAVLSPRGDEHD